MRAVQADSRVILRVHVKPNLGRTRGLRRSLDASQQLIANAATTLGGGNLDSLNVSDGLP
jgi:hypothetical protein